MFETNYDPALARPSTIGESGMAWGTGLLAAFGYDGFGRPLYLARASGATTYLAHDSLRRLTAIGHDLQGGNAGDLALDFAYNPASGLRSVTRSNDAYAWTGHYAVNRAYTTNGLNQYTNAGGAAFTYDLNGNLRTTPGTIGNETLTYTYDVENRLVMRTSNGASSTVTLLYDPLGRLFSVTANGASTQFLYDGDALVAEYGASGTLLRRFVHGPNAGVDDPLVWYEGSSFGDRRWLHTDERGSIVGVSNNAGTSNVINRYDEYGIPSSTNTGRFQYTGQIWMPELGLYYYKARVYSPYLGRFLQTDPIGYDDQFNLYAYVGNDPVNRRDPTGMQHMGDPRGQVVDYFVGIGSDLVDLVEGIFDEDRGLSWALHGMPPTLGGGAFSTTRVVAGLSTTVRGTSAGERAAARAAQIHGELDVVAQSRRTTAVLETNRGSIIASGGRDLSPRQTQALRSGEMPATARETHAEVTALQEARSTGAQPRAIGASRPICADCRRVIVEAGGTMTGANTAVWQSIWRRILPFR